LVFELTLQPRGLAINSATGLITWTPDDLQIGDHNVKLRVRDSFNTQDLQEWQILVSPNTNSSTGDEGSGVSTAMCMAISEEPMRDQCLINLAVQNGDFSICAEVSTARISECTAEVAESITSMCDAISSVYYKDYCYKDIAVQHDDDQYCMLITDPIIQQDCYDSV